MQNASIQADGEAMPAVTRRPFLATSAGAGVASLAASIAANATAAAGDDDANGIDRLLAAYLVEARRERSLSEEYRAAWDSLPAWVRPGPEAMFSDGSKGGQEVGWPENAVLPTPDPNQTMIRYTIRTSPAEAWRRATILMPAAGPVRRRQRLAGFKAVRKVMARIREQKAEKAEVGIPQLSVALDASSDRLSDLEGRITALADGVTPTDIATVALFEFLHAEERFAFVALERAAPHLSGLLRLLVDDMIANGPKDIRGTMLAGADHPRAEAV